MQSETELAREIKLTDWSMAGILSDRSSGVQIPRDICTRLKRYLYSAQCSWIIKLLRYRLLYMVRYASTQGHPKAVMWLATERVRWGFPTRKWCTYAINKSQIDQACLLQIAGYRPLPWVKELMEPVYVLVCKHAIKAARLIMLTTSRFGELARGLGNTGRAQRERYKNDREPKFPS